MVLRNEECVRFVGILLLHLTVVSCSGAPGPVTGEWSELEYGYQVALRAPASTSEKGEDVPILIVYRNTSNRAVTVPASPYLTLRISRNGRVIGETIGNIDIPEKKRTLLPGQGLELKETGITQKWGTGRYRLSGTIGGMELSEIKVKLR